jgi:hypothetical protein
VKAGVVRKILQRHLVVHHLHYPDTTGLTGLPGASIVHLRGIRHLSRYHRTGDYTLRTAIIKDHSRNLNIPSLVYAPCSRLRKQSLIVSGSHVPSWGISD